MRQFKNVSVLRAKVEKDTFQIFIGGTPENYVAENYKKLAQRGVYLLENVDVSFDATQITILTTDKSRQIYTNVHFCFGDYTFIGEEESKKWIDVVRQEKKSFFTGKVKVTYALECGKSWKQIIKTIHAREIITSYGELRIHG